MIRLGVKAAYICLFIFAPISPAVAQVPIREEAQLVGGPCEGCEAIFEYGDRRLSPVDTIPGFTHTEPKLKITGTIYEPDGKTPAEGVVLYVYQTNRDGLYAAGPGETGWGQRHGSTRGWMRTGKDGRYTFYTFRPASYPKSMIPAHIHPTILEPNGRYYWLGSYHFDDDPFLTDEERSPANPRGGSTGLLHLERQGALLVGTRDFILGRNIPDYE